MSNMLELLLQHKIVAILRGIEDRHADDTAQALIDGGIHMMEITMNTGGAAAMIERWRSKFDGKAAVGAAQ